MRRATGNRYFYTVNMNISLYSTEECEKLSQSASLRYVDVSKPGITREKQQDNFVYIDADNVVIKDEKTLERLNNLKIPPAWHDVWICPYANGHIQATGKDNKNRKQYRYHQLWREARNQQKFHMMIDFGRALPLVRKHVKKELNRPFKFEKNQIICAIIYLLDNFSLRIGNQVYARINQSFGATTLRKKHVSVQGTKAILHFKGKNNKEWHIILKDKKIIRILKKCMDIPGYELFKYLGQDNKPTVITSQDLNYYLQSLTSHSLTAKDFRTWFACSETLWKLIHEDDQLSDIIREVAHILGHTPAICQKNYINPEILTFYQSGQLTKWLQHHKKIETMDADRLLLYWLEHHHY